MWAPITYEILNVTNLLLSINLGIMTDSWESIHLNWNFRFWMCFILRLKDCQMSWCSELRVVSKDSFYFRHCSLLATASLLSPGGKAHLDFAAFYLWCYTCFRTKCCYGMNMGVLHLKAVHDAHRQTKWVLPEIKATSLLINNNCSHKKIYIILFLLGRKIIQKYSN